MEPEQLAYTVPFQLTKTIRRDPYDALQGFSAAGKLIVITGAGSGIGAASAVVWARAGAEGIALAGRRLEKLEETASQIRALKNGSKTKVLAVPTDVTKDADVANLFAQTVKTFGRSPDVVLSNAGAVEVGPMGEQGVDVWWGILSLNLKGVYATAHHFIKSQPNPKEPKGTFIETNSIIAGMIAPGFSAYSVSKLGGQRLIEYLDTEYPTLRSFSLFPGLVKTPMLSDDLVGIFGNYAHDHVDLTGLLSLYLSESRADYLKGGLASVNWDVKEMEAHKDEIQKDKLLHLKWVPILPVSGGKGLQ
ncbi:hypothetical protein LTR47_005356 [Exophiala xenobiotica]|nr:hypothetical protein LTR92_006393 [Exophiala xenobiotica]KAK5222708.1 hypothetical protein LTR72_005545 [Exophiala xenobiotica]KAK5233733.1 hypothetical protein LTR47_005356 [Exophiala xenobiotica]KAK5247938.1 hypothetical protein LTS06_006927 [Exophiala xenobiotica]KAK5297475.1 hypothetical protein LTR14_003206 [Exophiala xenobiotica]